METNKQSRAGGEIVKGLHEQSLRRAFSHVPEEGLKKAAQSMRERIDWYGRGHEDGVIYDAMMDVVKIYDPEFETKFVPAQ
jgi:hypothetical protein